MVGFSQQFDTLEKPVMALLSKNRTDKIRNKLVALLAPIWTYYINYYLYRFKIYDKHPEHDDVFNEMFVKCVELLSKVQYEGTDFNRVKRYFNKSIHGWIFNKLYYIKKKDLEYTKEELSDLWYADSVDQFKEVEYYIDLNMLEAHIKKQVPFCLEYYTTIFGMLSLKQRTIYACAYKRTAYKRYFANGQLLNADEFCRGRIGRAFLGVVHAAA